MPEPPKPSNEPATPLSDSPWFWAALFILAAIATLVVVNPKFVRRYARLERMNETREQMAASAAGDGPAIDDREVAVLDVTHDEPRRLSLGPLAAVLALMLASLAVCAGILSYWRSAARRLRREMPDGATR